MNRTGTAETSARVSHSRDTRAFCIPMTDTPSRITFLNRLYAALKERWSDGGFLSAEDFASVFKSARGHAGGKAKAEKLLMAEGGNDTGCIVCLVPDPDTAAALAVAGGLSPDQLHLTLCLFGDTEILGPVQRAEALLAVRDAAAAMPPLSGEISGIGRFTNGEQDVIYASLDAPALNELQDFVSTILEANGFEIADDHGFTPHFTLTYIESGMPSPIEIVEARPVQFGALQVWFGPEHITVPLLGTGVGGDGEMPPVLQDALGTDATGMPYEYLASETTELADLAAQGHTHRLFNSIAFAEAPAWIPYLPKPGVYAHPRYGPITITTERNQRFVSNFAAKVYQDRLAIDAEHETKLSGAVGWITGMRQNADGSADAQVEWTDRGKAFFRDDRFRYFSPEWYDSWQRPETGEMIRDVAIGGALCSKPFFKSPALRPLFASEGSLETDDTESQLQGDLMDAQQFAELETKLAALEAENATLKTASESASAQSTQLAERLAAVERERQQERFSTLIRNDGARWFGENAQHLTVLGTLAQTFGEESDQFSAYVAQQQGIAEMLRTSAAFQELGGDGGNKPESSEQKLSRMASERAATTGETFEQAYASVLDANPTLYA